MLKIEFPADRPDIAVAIGEALLKIGNAGTLTIHAQTTPSLCEQSTEGVNEILTETFGSAGAPFELDDPDAVNPAAAFQTGADPEDSDSDEDAEPPKVDKNGVPFDAKFCAVAKDPFYATGKTAGQWKRRKGVADDTYDKWYAGALSAVRTGQTLAGMANATVTPDADSEPVVNTAAAFGAATAPAGPTAPTNTGELMGWISEKQVAGKLTQAHLNTAYGQTGLTITDLFPPKPENVIKANVQSIYSALVAVAGV